MRPIASASAYTAPAVTEQAPPTQAVTEQTLRAQAKPYSVVVGILPTRDWAGLTIASKPWYLTGSSSDRTGATNPSKPWYLTGSSSNRTGPTNMQASPRSGDKFVQQGDNVTPRADPHPAEVPHLSVPHHSQITSTSSQSDLDAPWILGRKLSVKTITHRMTAIERPGQRGGNNGRSCAWRRDRRWRLAPGLFCVGSKWEFLFFGSLFLSFLLDRTYV